MLISQAYWRRLRPAWPVVPPGLWLALGLEAVATLNLFFRAEIWSSASRAYGLAGLVVVLGAAAVGAGFVQLLWQWVAAYAGPGWARWLLQGAVLGATLVLLLCLGFLGVGAFLWMR